MAVAADDAVFHGSNFKFGYLVGGYNASVAKRCAD